MDTSYGVLEQVDGRHVLRFVRTLPHDPAKVWRALTEPEHLAAWFPDRIEVDGALAAGARLTFSSEQGDFPDFHGELLVYDPPSVLELTWGDDTLRFELSPVTEGCRLTFTDTITELGKAARDGAGWHECLDRLGYELDSTPAPWSGHARWSEVHPAYVERLGPEASTIGPPDGAAATG